MYSTFNLKTVSEADSWMPGDDALQGTLVSDWAGLNHRPGWVFYMQPLLHKIHFAIKVFSIWVLCAPLPPPTDCPQSGRGSYGETAGLAPQLHHHDPHCREGRATDLACRVNGTHLLTSQPQGCVMAAWDCSESRPA